MKTYVFVKEDQKWYIDLPEFIAQGGTKADLQMVEGADTMLDVMAGKDFEVRLQIATEPFAGADLLTLTEKCDPEYGGGYYLMKKYNDNEINITMWLCQVTEFVFGEMPAEIYVKGV